MADEVEITNVGNGGEVASEETLERLVKSIEGFAKKSGMDPKAEAAKAQKAHTKTLEEDVEEIRKKIKAQKEYTSALKSSTRALSGMFSGAIGLLTSSLSGITGVLFNFAETILDGDDSLSGLMSNFPIFGSVLSRATRIIDDTVESFQTLSKVGATFSYDLGDLRIAARESRMSLEEYTNFVSQSSSKLAAFGGTVTGGARAVSGLVDSLDDELEQQLLRLGLSFEDINDSLANYLYLERGNARLRAQSEAEQARVASEYAKSLMTLNKLTGEDIKSIQERIAAEQRDFAFQRSLSRMNEDERENIQDAYRNIAATLGPDMAEIFKARIINEGIVPPDLAPQFATFSQTVAEIDREISRARTLTSDEYGLIEQQAAGLSRIITTQLQEAEKLGSILDVGAIVGEGIPAALLDTINSMQIDTSQLLTDGVVDPDKVTEVIEQAIKESAPPEGGAMDVFAAFLNALGNAKLSIEENLITPFAENVLTPALNGFTGWLNGFTEDNGEGSSLDNAMSFIKEQINAVASRLSTFAENFKADPEQAISNLVADIGNYFRDAIFGKMVDMDPRDLETDMQRQGGLIQTITDGFEALFENDGVIQSIKDGAKTAMQGMATGFSEFWNDPASNQLREDISGFFEEVLDSFLQLIQEKFGGFAGSSLSERNTRSLSERFMEGEDLSLEEKQDLINTLRSLQRERDESGAIVRGLGRLSGAASDFLGNLDARTTSDDAIRQSIESLGLNSYSQGTKGFQDFGSGTLAMLHGKEAVVPLDSPLGKLIDEIGSTKSKGSSDLESIITNLSNTLQNTTANQGNSEAIQELNTTMMQILAVLRQAKTIEERIEKNTSSIGGNIANGRVSNIR